MKSVKHFSLLVCLLLPLQASAGIRPYTAACESALALSAGPVHMRGQAGVYVLGAEAYELQRASENGFVCLVERNHPQGIIPQCFDARSENAHVARILSEGRMIRDGKTFAEILENREESFADGTFKPADGPGLAYMISDFNYIMAGNGDIVKVAPHVMYHAPGLTNADIGADPAVALQNPGMPFVNDQGPQGFMIGFTQKTSDSTAVLAACAGQLPDASGFRPFPPRPQAVDGAASN